MKSILSKRPVAHFVCVLLLLFAFPCRAHGNENSRGFSIRIDEVERMNWGTIAIPASGSRTLELSPLTQSVKGTGTVLFGTPRRGAYRIRGIGDERCSAITMDISDVSTGSPDLRLDHFEGVYSSMHIHSFPSPTMPPPDAQGKVLYLGARATVDSGMSARQLLPTFDINVIVN